MRSREALLILSILLGLSACAGLKSPEIPGSQAAVTVPLLRLAPMTRTGILDETQLLTFTFGKEVREAEALLYSDAAITKIAMVVAGQTAMSLSWDGIHLQQQRKPWVPQQLDAARILNDVQMVFWPVDAIRRNLPVGWQLDSAGPGQRTLRFNGQDIERISTDAEGTVSLENVAQGYRLMIRRSAAGPE